MQVYEVRAAGIEVVETTFQSVFLTNGQGAVVIGGSNVWALQRKKAIKS